MPEGGSMTNGEVVAMVRRLILGTGRRYDTVVGLAFAKAVGIAAQPASAVPDDDGDRERRKWERMMAQRYGALDRVR